MGNESLKSKRWSLPLYLFCVRIRSRYLWLAIFSMLITSLILGTVLGLAAAKGKEVKNDGLTVDLGYAKYQGMSLTNIHQFLGIRFAAPPTGDLRFRGPKPPLDESKKGVQQANKHGSWCLPTPSTSIQDGASEDCLYLDIYAPQDMSKSHPVYVFIQGGGYASNASPNLNGTKIVEAGDHDIVVVTFNYRVGPWGFLASKEVKADGDLNAGNLDQRWLLQWVQKYIHNFGGDPKRVTLGGASAGAASVNMQLMAYGGRDDGLFQAVASESNSYGQQLTVEESQYQYDSLIDRVGCKNEKDTLKCLRGKDIKTIAKNNQISATPGGPGGTPLFYYSNVIDGDFTQDYAYKQLDAGKFIKVPAIFGGTSNEGTVFTPGDMKNYGDINTFLQNQFTKLTASQLAEIDHLYPKDSATFPGKGEYWRTACNIWGEMRYNCPGINLNTAYASHNVADTWHYHWDVISETNAKNGYGATHTAESGSIWGTSGAPDDANIPYIQDYWASFIRTHDVNKLKKKEAVEWTKWDNKDYKKLRFVNDPTKNVVEAVDQTQRDRCTSMMKIGMTVRQ